MTVTFAEKLARMPHYEPGTSLDDARQARETADAIKLASNESPAAPHPAVVEAIAEGGRRTSTATRTPRPGCCGRGSPSAPRPSPARIAVSNGSCEILLAAAEALCEPGAEIVYAWPSFSIYPHMTALSGAREIRVPLGRRRRPRPRRDRGRDHRRDPDRDRLQPEQPDRDGAAGRADRRVPRRGARPRHRDRRRGLHRVPDRSTTPTRPSTCWPTTRTWSCCGPSASATASPACGSATRSARRSSAPPWTPCASPSASTRSPRPRRPRRSCTRTTSPTASSGTWSSGSSSRRASASSGLDTPDSQANFSWVDLGDHDEGEVIASLTKAGVAVRPGTPLGGPGHFRVTYGTRPENERFLAALVATPSGYRHSSCYKQ